MKHARILLTMLAFATVPLAAQSRSVNLTGKPLATLDEPFTNISGLVEMSGQQAVLLDPQESRLVMVNFATGAVTGIGRSGGGPGEWRQPMSVLPGPGGQAVVGDPGLGKLHLVGADGKISGAILPPADGGVAGISMTLARGIDNRGRLYFQSLPNPTDGNIPDVAEVRRYDPATKESQLITTVPSGMTGAASGGQGNFTVRMRSLPLAMTDAWVALPDGRVAVVRANPYRVDVVTGPSQIRTGPVVPHTPLRVTKADRDAYRERAASARPMMVTVGGGGGGTLPPGAFRQSGQSEIPDSDFPEVMPPFTGRGAVLVTPEGEIWVQRTRSANDKTPTYDIFSSDGRLAGKATLKPNSAVVGFGKGVVYVARQDPEDDLRYVEKYGR